jgi:hypothetical protein
MQRDKITCDYCGELFVPRRKDARFCSKACHNEWHIENRRQAIALWREMQRRQAAFFNTLGTTSATEDEEIQSVQRRA